MWLISLCLSSPVSTFSSSASATSHPTFICAVSLAASPAFFTFCAITFLAYSSTRSPPPHCQPHGFFSLAKLNPLQPAAQLPASTHPPHPTPPPLQRHQLQSQTPTFYIKLPLWNFSSVSASALGSYRKLIVTCIIFGGNLNSTLNSNPNKEQKFSGWESYLQNILKNPQDMRLNEQYIPVHRLLHWIMGWDPKWVTGPPLVSLHMTRTLVWFNDPGSQGKKNKKKSFWLVAEKF